MKKYILSLLLLFNIFLYADLSVAEIQKMVIGIHEKREGVKLETLQTTKEPFVRLQMENDVKTFVIPIAEEEIKTEVKLILHSIVNGRAWINESWTTVGEKIMGYTLKYIGKRGVVLRNGNHIRKLFLRKKKKNFFIFK